MSRTEDVRRTEGLRRTSAAASAEAIARVPPRSRIIDLATSLPAWAAILTAFVASRVLSTFWLALAWPLIGRAQPANAIRGNDRFRGRPVPARAIAVIYTNRMQAVTVASTGIKSIPDMKGKRVSTGAPGSATEVMALRLIEAAGLDPAKDFRARERLSPAESTNAVKDGKLDAYFFVSGIPTSAITDLGASPGVQIQMIDHDQYTAKIVEKHGPVYFNEVIPAGTYPGQATDNKQMSVANVLAVREDMPPEMVTSLIKLTWEGREDLARTHAEARNFKLEGQKTAAAGIPWHPAAEAYWRSVGASLA